MLIPQIMPKPDVVALTGGYRRTPFMQIGADIYCDTALICDELERRYPTPVSTQSKFRPASWTRSQWADNQLFWWGAIAYSFQSKTMAFIFDGVPAEIVKAFGGGPRGDAGWGAANASGRRCRHVARLSATDRQHAGRAHRGCLGKHRSLADFAAYHPLLVRAPHHTTGRHPFVHAACAAVDGPRRRNADIALPAKLASADAIRIAHDTKPEAPTGEWHDEHGIAAGEPVTVTPLDYAFDPVAGDLVAATAKSYALRRFDERAGEVVVHFPRVGFKLERRTRFDRSCGDN